LIKSVSVDVEPFFQFQGKVFFSGSTEDFRNVLWVTDGTRENTFILNDIRENIISSKPTSFTVFKDKLYFTADKSFASAELWVTDGTIEGTQLVFEREDEDKSRFHDLVVYQDYLYFGSSVDKLFRLDAENRGEEMMDVWIDEMIATTESLYFKDFHNNIYTYNQSTNATLKIHDSPSSFNTTNITIIDNELYFIYQDDNVEKEFWHSGGSLESTKKLVQIFVFLGNRVSIDDTYFFEQSIELNGSLIFPVKNNEYNLEKQEVVIFIPQTKILKPLLAVEIIQSLLEISKIVKGTLEMVFLPYPPPWIQPLYC